MSAHDDEAMLSAFAAHVRDEAVYATDEYCFTPEVRVVYPDAPAGSLFHTVRGKLALSYTHAAALARTAHRVLHARGRPRADMQVADTDALRIASLCALVANADCYTMLNVRKTLITLGHGTPADELALLNVLFSKQPKSGDAWAHRRWVVRELVRRAPPSEELCATLASELLVCGRFAERYARNYYAWTHRSTLLDLVAQRAGGVLAQAHADDLLGVELRASEAWVGSHVSDHSGWHYRARVAHAARERAPPVGELGLCLRIGALYAGHASVWSAVRGACTRVRIALPVLAERVTDRASALCYVWLALFGNAAAPAAEAERARLLSAALQHLAAPLGAVVREVLVRRHGVTLA